MTKILAEEMMNAEELENVSGGGQKNPHVEYKRKKRKEFEESLKLNLGLDD